MVALGRLGSMKLDAAEVLCADEAVLARTDQSNWSAVVSVEGAVAEPVGYEHILIHRVLNCDNRAIRIEATEDDVGDGAVRLNLRLDDLLEERRERDALPVEVGGRPSRYTVEIGGQVPSRQCRQVRDRKGERGHHDAVDLDHRIGRNWGSRSVEVRAEAGEPLHGTLPGR